MHVRIYSRMPSAKGLHTKIHAEGQDTQPPGGTNTQNIAAWRSDDLTWDWKCLSVREITAPST